MSAISSGKVDKYEYLTGEKIFPSDRSRIAPNQCLSYLIDWGFQGINRLIGLSFADNAFGAAQINSQKFICQF